ncbi:MAG TPA: DUF92 domain-containing protein [Vicinamibacteria bacterium]|nr:DUF92 domain-containing protein [Vicinamibacteria bacterium]
MSLGRGELARRVVHVGCVAFALLLRVLTWWQAALLALVAFLFNWQVLPRIGGRGMWRGADVARGYPVGILAYPLSVLALVLLFHDRLWMAAAGWGILAVGDGMASLVGQASGGPRLPWNGRKGWAGSAAFVAFGTAAAAFLAAWAARSPLDPAAPHWPRTAGTALALALVCALVESLPTTLDDNVTVPLTVALVLPLLASAEPELLLGDPLFVRRVAMGLLVNAAIALPAFLARSVDARGALSAVVIGTAITAGLGLPGLALMIAFFVLGTAATKLGYRKKAARGIAQEKGGARGFEHAWANGFVPAFLAVLAAMAPPGLRDLLALAYAAAVATAAADTCSSEVGKAYGRRTFLITSLRPVAPGTEGAVSFEGTLGGLVAALAVGAVGVASGLFGWPEALVVGVAGLLGSLAESVLGTVAERRGFMGNHLLNAANTAIGAGIAVLIVRVLSAMPANAG